MSNINLFELITTTSTLDSFYKEVFCIKESKKAIEDAANNAEEKNKSVIFKNYKYGGEILERFVDHLDEISEAELESLAVISSVAMFHKSFTRYGNQIELGYANLIEASKKYPDNHLLKISIYLYDLFEKESNIHHNSKELIDLFNNLETKQMDFLLQVLISASINSLPHSHWDPMAKSLLNLEKPKKILAAISNSFRVLNNEKFKSLSQFNRVFLFIYAGLFKKIFNLLKKDFKGYDFYESLVKASNDVLREKSSSLNYYPEIDELLNDLELNIVFLLNYKFNFLITTKYDYAKLDTLMMDYDFKEGKDEFALNFIAHSNTSFNRNVFESDKMEFYLSYISLREYKTSKFEKTELKKFHDWLIKDEGFLRGEDKKVKTNLAIYFFNELHQFSDISLFEKITEKMLDENIFDYMYNSNSTIVSYLFEKIELMNNDLKNRFFVDSTVYNSIYNMLKNNEKLIIQKINIVPEKIIIQYVSDVSNEYLISNQLKYLEIANNLEMANNADEKNNSDILDNPLFLLNYIEHYKTYDFIPFLQSLYQEIKTIVQKYQVDSIFYKNLFNELHDAISYIKIQNEELVIDSLKKYFVSSEKDALEAIEQLKLNDLGYSFKNNIAMLSEVRKQIPIDLFSSKEVQEKILNKIENLYLKAKDSYARNDIDYLVLLSDFNKHLKTVDFLTEESKITLSNAYNNVLSELDIVKNKYLFEEIMNAFNKTNKLSLSL